MVSLKTAGLRFNSKMRREDGLPFFGTIEPDLEGKLIGYDFSFPRRLLRVLNDSPIKTLDVIQDVLGRRYLVADHDGSFARNVIEYRSHMLIPMNRHATWQRETTAIDTLTKLPKSTGRANLGLVWILLERVNREAADTTIRVKEEAFTAFSATKFELNDVVDNMVVKRVSVVRGVYLLELQ
ncbi:hypothetical protein [Rhizobium arsenicireducens]